MFNIRGRRFLVRIPTEDGTYVGMNNAETGEQYLEKADTESTEDDSELELAPELKEFKYVAGLNRARRPKLTLIVPSLRYLPFPAESWPDCSQWLENWTAGIGNTVDIYTLINGRETTLSFTSLGQRQVVQRMLQSEMRRRREAGEKQCFTVEALKNRFLDI